MKRNQGNIIFALLLAMAVGLVIGLVGFFLGQRQARLDLREPTPSQANKNLIPNTSLETSTTKPDNKKSEKDVTWKVFANTKYHYSFYYPNTLEINRGPSGSTDEEIGKTRGVSLYSSNIAKNKVGTSLNFDTNEFESTGESRNCTNLEVCVEKVISILGSDLSKNLNIEESTKFGVPTKSLVYERKTSSYNQKNFHLFFVYDQNFYHIHFSSDSDDYAKEKAVFDEVLDTLRFSAYRPSTDKDAIEVKVF